MPQGLVLKASDTSIQAFSLAESQLPFYTCSMRNGFTAVIERNGDSFVASCPEIPRANGRGNSEAVCRDSLAAAIRLVLDERLNAESIVLDERFFYLNEDQFQRFTAMLDAPPADNPGLARLLATKAPWDEPRPTSQSVAAPNPPNAPPDR